MRWKETWCFCGGGGRRHCTRSIARSGGFVGSTCSAWPPVCGNDGASSWRAISGERLEAEADSELLGLGVVDPARWTGAYWSMFDARMAAERTQDGDGDSASDPPDLAMAGR